MANTKKKLLGLLVAIPSVIAIVGCGNTEGQGVYTLHEATTGGPKNWSCTSWETNADSYIPGYCEAGFVDIAMADPKDDTKGYTWVYEMATAIEDVTESITDAEKRAAYGLDDEGGGSVYDITLNEGAKWEDGTPITADTYIESMKEVLDPAQKNYRASSYYNSEMSLVGAANYFNAGIGYCAYPGVSTAIAPVEQGGSGATLVDEENVYIDMDHMDIWDELGMDASYFGSSGGYHAYMDIVVDGKTVNLVDKYKDVTILTEAIVAEFVQTAMYTSIIGGAAEGMTDAQTVMYFFGSAKLNYPKTDWDTTIGLKKLGDYKLEYVTVDTCSKFNFLVNCTSNWLVKTDLYDSLKTQTGDLTASSYGTSKESYMSYGPYKLVSYEKDKQIKFARNENWYGWKDGKHENQYKTTNIVCDIIPEHASQVLAFKKGDLDGISLTAADLAEFGQSEYLLYTPETYTGRITFDSNLADLQALETTAGDGKNKQILSNEKFREAFGLSIDRTRFNKEGTAGNEAAYGLFNSLYYYDVENDPTSVYRNSDEAKIAVCNAYGMEYGADKQYKTLDEAYKAVTGLDVEKAKTLFDEAVTEAVADGIYTEGQEVSLTIGYYDATTTTNAAQTRLLNEFITAATKGTKLEGKVTITGKSFNGDESRYDAIDAGTVEMANVAWGGAAFYPFSAIRCYTDDDYADPINETRSWNPASTSLTITYDFDEDGVEEDLTKSYTDWSVAINAGGEYYKAKMATKLKVLASLEEGILEKHVFSVVSSYADVSLYSKKIKYATTNYNIMYGYGGLRYMDYNYDDAAWSKYVSDHGGQISY